MSFQRRRSLCAKLTTTILLLHTARLFVLNWIGRLDKHIMLVSFLFLLLHYETELKTQNILMFFTLRCVRNMYMIFALF